MILANGTVHPSTEQGSILADLGAKLQETRSAAPLRCEDVIAALDRMGKHIAGGAFDALLTEDLLREQVQFAAKQLSREALEYKVKTELGDRWEEPFFSEVSGLTVRTMPLGVILHIAAGNMDALPAWSVIEGLLTGNINLLKLPHTLPALRRVHPLIELRVWNVVLCNFMVEEVIVKKMPIPIWV